MDLIQRNKSKFYRAGLLHEVSSIKSIKTDLRLILSKKTVSCVYAGYVVEFWNHHICLFYCNYFLLKKHLSVKWIVFSYCICKKCFFINSCLYYTLCEKCAPYNIRAIIKPHKILNITASNQLYLSVRLRFPQN